MTRWRGVGRSLLAASVLAIAALPAWADDDDVPIDATAAIPGLKLLGLLVLAVIAIAVWYHLRKRAILRSHNDDGTKGPPGPG